MPLATQCPHCHTTFRVANDQLKLHAGLVRCGACRQTFNGIEHLLAPGAKPAPAKRAETAPVAASFETMEPSAHEPTHLAAHLPTHVPLRDEPEAIASATPVGAETQDQSANAPAAPIQEPNPISTPSSLDFDLGQDDVFAQSAAATLKTAAPEVEETQFQQDAAAFDTALDDAEEFEPLQEISVIEFAETEPFESGASAEQAMPAALAGSDGRSHDGADGETTNEAEPDSEKPIFVVQAEKKQRRSRIVRIGMLLCSVILFLTLLAQATFSFRHQIAAWFPQTKPALQEACKLLRCRIETPAQIDMIHIESNELQALVTDGNIFSLAVLLQNTSATLQSWPMLELTLNDSKEQTVLRRVFTPAEYLSNKNDLIKGFAPDSEQTVKLYFELNEVKAAGYHLSVFYP